VRPENVTGAIEDEATKPDNRRKLAASGCVERHLFVYIHAQKFLPWISLIESEPPCQPPALPPEITHIWAAADTYSGNGFRVWRADQAHWEDFGTVAGSPVTTLENGAHEGLGQR
jgi:hypothetical protein